MNKKKNDDEVKEGLYGAKPKEVMRSREQAITKKKENYEEITKEKGKIHWINIKYLNFYAN